MSIHKTVLLKEAVDMLNLKAGDVVVDATLGGGGHAERILKKIGDEGILVAIDIDAKAIESFKSKVEDRIFLINDNFANLKKILEILKIEKVDAILADLGWSLDQLKGRGMSFRADEDLDMRLSGKGDLTAKKIVNEYSRDDLAEIIKEFGEERFCFAIAGKIMEARKIKKIATTKELAEIIKRAVPKKYRYGKIHPATKTFQAIRILVNSELSSLDKFINESMDILKPGGRLSIISFHSLEDRIVKNKFRENARGCICLNEVPTECSCGKKPLVSVLTKKPIIPSEEEIGENPRSRSAKLRVAEKK